MVGEIIIVYTVYVFLYLALKIKQFDRNAEKKNKARNEHFSQLWSS